jgi:hypothetical protein
MDAFGLGHASARYSKYYFFAMVSGFAASNVYIWEESLSGGRLGALGTVPVQGRKYIDREEQLLAVCRPDYEHPWHRVQRECARRG